MKVAIGESSLPTGAGHGGRSTRLIRCVPWVLVVWLAATDAVAQTSGGTLWDFLGIPTNSAAQASSNPAIAAAAKAKAAKHEICKKKKAIQYLAGMGCSPEHPEVAAALLAAMGDPEEPVRYEAVKAVLQTAAACQSNEQKRESRKALSLCERCHDCKKKVDKAICDCIERLCGKAPPKEHKHKLKSMLGRDDCPQEPAECGKGQGSCCTAEIREKLQQLAYGRDERGCFLEHSSRVRELAAAALQACSACGGCGCQPGGSSYVVREMPPEEAREMVLDSADQLLDGDCVYENLIVPTPGHGQPTLADPPPSAPLPPEPPGARDFPAPEPIPTPSARIDNAATRFAMLPGAHAPTPAAVLPPRPASRGQSGVSMVWNPADPADTLARSVPAASTPDAVPAIDVEDVRRWLGTPRVELAIPRLPRRPSRNGPAGPVPPREPRVSKPADTTADVSAAASAPAHWPLRCVAIALTMAAAAAISGVPERCLQRWRHRHEERLRSPADVGGAHGVCLEPSPGRDLQDHLGPDLSLVRHDGELVPHPPHAPRRHMQSPATPARQ